MTTEQSYHDDKIISITSWMPDTAPFRPVDQPHGTDKFGGVHYSTWPADYRPLNVSPICRYVEIEREHAAPGPPLNLAVGQRGIVQRVKARLRR